MRILCVIDHLGSGGAQRQLVTLACGLKQRGHEVEFFVYFPKQSFFGEPLIANKIPLHEFSKGRGFSPGVVRKLSSLIRSVGYDVVLSYLTSPNVYAELSSIFAPSAKLVVSERASHFADRTRLGALVRRNLHRLADHIVVNSLSHRSWLIQHFPWMRGRLTTIYNGFDMRHFWPQPNPPPERRDLRLLVVGRTDPGKNFVTLLKALQLFHAAHGWAPQLDWVGRRDDGTPAGRTHCQQLDALLDSFPAVKQRWQWLGERSDVPGLLREHHALIHPTFHEGLPNAICEALAGGRPVLASAVCDNGFLVPDGGRGFLFDPNSPHGIAASIDRLVTLSERDWFRMSTSARAYAEEALSIDRCVTEYENLFIKLVANDRP